MLIPATLFLGAATLLAVLKSPPRALAHVTAPERLTPATTCPTWNPAAPLAERFESVTVLDTQRGVQIVEVLLGRRELVYVEAAK